VVQKDEVLLISSIYRFVFTVSGRLSAS